MVVSVRQCYLIGVKFDWCQVWPKTLQSEGSKKCLQKKVAKFHSELWKVAQKMMQKIAEKFQNLGASPFASVQILELFGEVKKDSIQLCTSP